MPGGAQPDAHVPENRTAARPQGSLPAQGEERACGIETFRVRASLGRYGRPSPLISDLRNKKPEGGPGRPGAVVETLGGDPTEDSALSTAAARAVPKLPVRLVSAGK